MAVTIDAWRRQIGQGPALAGITFGLCKEAPARARYYAQLWCLRAIPFDLITLATSAHCRCAPLSSITVKGATPVMALHRCVGDPSRMTLSNRSRGTLLPTALTGISRFASSNRNIGDSYAI